MPTGVALALPSGLRRPGPPALGLAARHGITIVNAPGHRRRRLPRRDPRQPGQPRPPRAVHGAPRGPDRPAGRPAGRAGQFVEVDSLDEHLAGGHWTWRQWRIRRPTAPDHAQHDRRRTDRPVSIFRAKQGHGTSTRGGPQERREPAGPPDPADATDGADAAATAVPAAAAPSRAAGPFDPPRSTTRRRPPRPGCAAHPRRGRHGAAAGGRRGGPDRSSGPPRSSATRPCSCRRSPRPAARASGTDIRSEIAESIISQGGTADEARRPARHRAAHPDALGRTRRPHRLRPGPVRRRRRAALVPARGLLRPCGHRRRGGRPADRRSSARPSSSAATSAMAPREMLPLRLPATAEDLPTADEDADPGAQHRRPVAVRARPRDHRGPLGPTMAVHATTSTSQRASRGCASVSPDGSPDRSPARGRRAAAGRRPAAVAPPCAELADRPRWPPSRAPSAA